MRELNDYRLEGGGFGSRLKARLFWEPEKTADLHSLALRRPPWSLASALNQALSNALEVVAWKARVVRL